MTRKHCVAALLAVQILASCSKTTMETNTPTIIPPLPDASYTMQVTTYWSPPAFVVPAGVHITAITGMVHTPDTMLWKPGLRATSGLEDVAEIGAPAKMNIEIDTVIAAQKASERFNITPPAINGSVQKNLTLTQKFSEVSFASMIAPSPDWFLGIHNFSLISNNEWIKDTLVNIYVYDAGTEDGDVFGYSNPPTTPQQNVNLLQAAQATVLANGNPSLAHIATVRFTKN
jgi:hypothetical protein